MMHGMREMMDGMWGPMSAMMIASAVFYLALLAAAVLGIVWLTRALRNGYAPTPARLSDAEGLLRRRYAADEISNDEYHERMAGLHA